MLEIEWVKPMRANRMHDQIGKKQDVMVDCTFLVVPQNGGAITKNWRQAGEFVSQW
jgi:hypothetical protein